MKLVARVTLPAAMLERMAEMIVAELERTEVDVVEETDGTAEETCGTTKKTDGTSEETGENGEANFFTTRYSGLC